MRAVTATACLAIAAGLASAASFAPPPLFDCTAVDSRDTALQTQWTCVGAGGPRTLIRRRSGGLENAKEDLRKRQPQASDGVAETSPATSAGTSAAAATTTEPAATTTTSPVPETTSQAPAVTTTSAPEQTTSAAAPTTTSQPAQQTTTAQQATTTSQAAQQTTTTTAQQQPTTTPGAQPTTSSSPIDSATTATRAADSSAASPSDASRSQSSAVAAASSASSLSAAISSASAAGSSISLVTHTYTSTFTNADGSIGTSTGTLTSASVVPVQNNSSGNTAKTWGIVGGVVGGVVVISAIVFLVYRLTQRRFSSLDDGDIDEIKWPDLLPDGQDISATTTTLMPLSTHRTNGAGVGDDGMTEYGGEGDGAAGSGNLGGHSMSGVYAPVSDGRRQSTATLLSQQGYHDPYANGTSFADYSRQASYEQLAMADGGADAFSRGYDPFAGPGGGMIPQQGTVYPPSPPQHHTAQFGGVWPGSAAPRGAPGAAGAMRMASPPPPHHARTMSPPPSQAGGASLGHLPSIRRSESPFAVPGVDVSDDLNYERGGKASDAMKAYVIEEYIKPEQLPTRLVEWKDPEPKDNEILIDVHYAGLNFFDILQIQGKYQLKPPFPWISGAEFSGVVASNSPIPKGCTFVPGKTRVFGAGQGSYAEKIKVDYRTVIEVPASMGLDAAAGLYVTMPTSYAALVNRARTQPGEWVLVHAAAGGVGLAAVQIAKALGAKVIATAGSAAKLEVAKKFGADYGIDYTQTGWQDKVKEITKGHGADVVYDPVGLVNESLKCIAWNGRVIIVGFAAGSIQKIPANLLLLKNVAAMGVHWGAYARNEPEAVPQVWKELLALFESGKVRGPVFEKVFDGLEAVPEGLRALGARETWGKAVVKVKGGREGRL